MTELPLPVWSDDRLREHMWSGEPVKLLDGLPQRLGGTSRAIWPGGFVGTFTVTNYNGRTKLVDGFTITNDRLGILVTQPAVTRGYSGEVTSTPDFLVTSI